jgi:predicted DNA-binding protein
LLTSFQYIVIFVLQMLSKPYCLRLPIEIEERLATLARKTGRTKSFYMRQALTESLGKLERDRENHKIARKGQHGT